MPHLNCNFFTIQFCFVNLSNWSRSYRFRIKFLKHLFNFHTICSSYDLLSLAELMLRSMFSKDLKFFGHFFTNNIPSMTQILKSFDPNHSCPLYCWQKQTKPPVSSSTEQVEWQTNNWWGKNNTQLNKPANIFGRRYYPPLLKRLK